MHNSKDVGETVASLFDEYNKLGIETFRCGIGTIHQERKMEVWTAKRNADGMVNFFTGYMDMTMHPLLQGAYSAWKKKEESYEYELKGDDLKEYFSRSNNNPHYPLKYDLSSLPSRLIFSTFYFAEGFLFAFTLEKIPTESTKIFKRFSFVFGQTYRRFLDLQKAEAQAREAQIETGLERVRSRSMGMQKSEELKEVIKTVYQQFIHLKINLDHAGFVVDYKPKGDWHFWIADEQDIPSKITHPYFESVWANQFNEAKQKGADFFVTNLNFEEKNKFYNELLSYVPGLPEASKEFYLNCPGLAATTVVLEDIGLYIENFSGIPYTNEENKTLIRFGKVFQQTYTRFLDLQKAEAQTREAQIEAALERVRSKTMAMHNSKDVGESVAALFDELTALGVLTSLDRCGIGIMQLNEMMELWTADKTTGKTELTIGYLNMQFHILLKNVYQNWLDKKETYQYILEGNDKLEYYEAMRNQANYKIRNDYYSAYERVVHTDFFFKEGCLYVFSLTEFTTEATSIFIRFVNVFGQTYRRYLDLQKAEAQAKEAQIEAALERVRSRTLAMQKSDELAETAAVLFQQLITLGIEPNRLYITIIHSESDEADFWITNEDGSKLTDAYSANLEDNSTFKKMYEGWKKQLQHLVIDMQGEELENYFHYLQSRNVPFKGGLEQKRRVQHLAYFSKGFIGMASPDEQPAESLQLLERFAAVFNLTFTRFNDLKIAEAHAEQADQDLIAIKEAKQKAEEALTELQATQKQLIQSEKMASLGELTAGIAHEIQNPLNFVNNFSEVSTELVDEMNEEIAKGNLEDAAAIANDLKQNLEKINHHGKRAGDIVKGMLQHSRSSSATKEPTDINKLADEYLRLAYHGLRAKDKSFNATLKTDYGESIGNINIIPQDMGRVILNLITNAFYVVAEKKKQLPEGYEPTVSVSTKKVNDKVEIKVSDNGNGISQKVLDKIFQPFFTTKPTGQGTGLGLSLSYDIVKAHGGELKVGTKEGEGSEFIILLPVI
jgi:signal transduction histidine kinase